MKYLPHAKILTICLACVITGLVKAYGLVNQGVTMGGSVTYQTNEHTCDDSLTSGIQCTLSTPDGTKAAYKVGANTTPLYRPA